MNGASHPSAVIIGAGIVGAACALALARDGFRVVVLESRFAAGGATAAGMGHLVVMDDSPEQLSLTAYSLRLWHALGPLLPRTAELEECGTLWVAEDESQLAVVRAKRETYARAGIDARVLSGDELRLAEPGLRPGLAGALEVPGDAVLYPPTAAMHLLTQARALGASVREGAVVRSLSPHAAICDAESFRADVIVNAAGATAAVLVPELPIVPRKGHLVITDRCAGVCSHQLVELGYLRSAHEMTSESVAFNVQPRRTGQVLIGSSRELVGWDGSINPRLVRAMLARARELLPVLADLSVIRIWTGFRPATSDKLPLIGRWEAIPGLWIAAGHEGLGITTALASAQILADQIAGREPAIDATPFSPMRVLASSAAAVS